MVNNQDKQNKRKTAPNLFDIIPVVFLTIWRAIVIIVFTLIVYRLFMMNMIEKYLIEFPAADCAMPYPYI